MTQLLIVHRDADIGRQLVQLVKDYTGYESAFTRSESETLVWLRRQSGLHPRILLVQLDAAGLDGPRLFRHEGLPVGPPWPDVQRLITSSKGRCASPG